MVLVLLSGSAAMKRPSSQWQVHTNLLMCLGLHKFRIDDEGNEIRARFYAEESHKENKE